MATSTAPPADVTKSVQRRRLQLGKTAVVVLVAVAALFIAALVLWSRWWPFEQQHVIQTLEQASDSQVQIRGFHKTYFPSPGCVLDAVVFTRGHDPKPLISVEKLIIRSTYSGMLAHHISRIVADGMHVYIPRTSTGEPFHARRSTMLIGEIIANGSTLELERHGDKPPLRFEIHQLSLRNVGAQGSLTYKLSLHNPTPPAEITATGKFGAWNERDPAQTFVSGEYKFEHADLSVFHGIAGTLSSAGKFDGKLGHIDVSGITDTPDFEVKTGGHPVQLITEFSAYVDGTNGDTFLKRVDAHFAKTHIVADGSIAKSANGKGKTALINISAKEGRIDDVLALFVKEKRPSMSGIVTLHAKVEIPPGKRRFLEKIIVHGNFGVGAGEFSNPATQESVNKLSAGARGEEHPVDPETVLTDLTGQVVMENGIANLSDLSFGVPGASSRMGGTYNLIDHKIDLRGQMQVDSKLSNSTSGVKSLLLKVMHPFFKKRNKAELLPVRISGTYEKPSFGLDLNDKKAQEVGLPPQTR